MASEASPGPRVLLDGALAAAKRLGAAFRAASPGDAALAAVDEASAALLDLTTTLAGQSGLVCSACRARITRDGEDEARCVPCDRPPGWLPLHASVLVHDLWVEALRGDESRPGESGLGGWLHDLARSQHGSLRGSGDGQWVPLAPYDRTGERVFRQVLLLCVRLLELRSQRDGDLVLRLRVPLDVHEEYRLRETKEPSKYRRSWELAPWIEGAIVEALATTPADLSRLKDPCLREEPPRGTVATPVVVDADGVRSLPGHVVERLVSWIDVEEPPADVQRAMRTSGPENEWPAYLEHLVGAHELQLAALRTLAALPTPDDLPGATPDPKRPYNRKVMACLVRAYSAVWGGDAGRTAEQKRVDSAQRRGAALNALLARIRRAGQAADVRHEAAAEARQRQEITLAVARAFDPTLAIREPAALRVWIEEFLRGKEVDLAGSRPRATEAERGQLEASVLQLRAALEATVPPGVLFEAGKTPAGWYAALAATSTAAWRAARTGLVANLAERVVPLLVDHLKHVVLARGHEPACEKEVTDTYRAYATYGMTESVWSDGRPRSADDALRADLLRRFEVSRRFRGAALEAAVQLRQNPLPGPRLAGYRMLVWCRPVRALPFILGGLDDRDPAIRSFLWSFVRAHLNGEATAELHHHEPSAATKLVLGVGSGTTLDLTAEPPVAPGPTSDDARRWLEQVALREARLDALAVRADIAALIDEPLIDPFVKARHAEPEDALQYGWSLTSPRNIGGRSLLPRYTTPGEELLVEALVELPPGRREAWSPEQEACLARFERQTAALRYLVRASRSRVRLEAGRETALLPGPGDRAVLLFGLRHPDPDLFEWARSLVLPGRRPESLLGTWGDATAPALARLTDRPTGACQVQQALSLRLQAVCSRWHGRAHHEPEDPMTGTCGRAAMGATIPWVLALLQRVGGESCRLQLERMAYSGDIETPWGSAAVWTEGASLQALRFLADQLRPVAFIRYVLDCELLSGARPANESTIAALIDREADDGTPRERVQALIELEDAERTYAEHDEHLRARLKASAVRFRERAGLSDAAAAALKLVFTTSRGDLLEKDDALIREALTALRDADLSSVIELIRKEQEVGDAERPYDALLHRVAVGDGDGPGDDRAAILWDWLARAGDAGDDETAARVDGVASWAAEPLRQAIRDVLDRIGPAAGKRTTTGDEGAASNDPASEPMRRTYDALEGFLSPRNDGGPWGDTHLSRRIRVRRDKRSIARSLIEALDATATLDRAQTVYRRLAAGDLLLEFALDPDVVGQDVATSACIPAGAYLEWTGAAGDGASAVRKEAREEFRARWIGLDGVFSGGLEGLGPIPASAELGTSEQPARLSEALLDRLGREDGPLRAFDRLGPWAGALTLSGVTELRVEAALFRTAQLRLFWRWLHTTMLPLAGDLFTKRHEYHLHLKRDLLRGEVELTGASHARFSERLAGYEVGTALFLRETCEVVDALGALLDDELLQLTLLDLHLGGLSAPAQEDPCWWPTLGGEAASVPRTEADEELDGVAVLADLLHTAWQVEASRARLDLMNFMHGMGIGPHWPIDRWRGFTARLHDDLRNVADSKRMSVEVVLRPASDRRDYAPIALALNEGLEVNFLRGVNLSSHPHHLQLHHDVGGVKYVVFIQRASGCIAYGEGFTVANRDAPARRSYHSTWVDLAPGDRVELCGYELALGAARGGAAGVPSRYPYFALALDGKLPSLGQPGSRFEAVARWRPLGVPYVTLADQIGRLEEGTRPPKYDPGAAKALIAGGKVLDKVGKIVADRRLAARKGELAGTIVELNRGQDGLYRLGHLRGAALKVSYLPRVVRIADQARAIEAEMGRLELSKVLKRADVRAELKRHAAFKRASGALTAAGSLVGVVDAFENYEAAPVKSTLKGAGVALEVLELLSETKRGQALLAKAARSAKLPSPAKASSKASKGLGVAGSVVSGTLAIMDLHEHAGMYGTYRQLASLREECPDAEFNAYEHVTERELRSMVMRDVLDTYSSLILVVAPFTGPAAPFLMLAGLGVALLSAGWSSYDSLCPPNAGEKLADFLGYEYFRWTDAIFDAAADQAIAWSSAAVLVHHHLVSEGKPGLDEDELDVAPRLILVMARAEE